jgi:hypothetical protein
MNPANALEVNTKMSEANCIVCEQVITNPVCPDCLASKMKLWLGEISVTLADDVDGFALDGMTSCLFCGKGMSLCAHCFTRDVYDQLVLRDETIAKEFAARFDYELRKELVA